MIPLPEIFLSGLAAPLHFFSAPQNATPILKRNSEDLTADYFFVSPPICTTKYFAGPVPTFVTLCVVPSAT
jgi:hypothetical protein